MPRSDADTRWRFMNRACLNDQIGLAVDNWCQRTTVDIYYLHSGSRSMIYVLAAYTVYM